ncbi:hypothetical protein [Yinghuangia soli]|uniref:Uncharacterized protein n=1 Tax=Yinghuangia soli TaxID=2908204 RepID=A0AA41PYN1_9ACTN|nr:hypothetical protein [Yinghuangia soli]MCF2526887.1 hypothetical protein [Yinghuangia soli]
MATATDIRKTLTDATPFYAFVGAGDLAVEKIRTVPERISGIKFDVPKFEVPKLELPKLEVPKIELPKIDIPTDPKEIRTRVSSTASDVQEKLTSTISAVTAAGKDAGTLPGKAQDFAKTQYGKAKGQVETQVGKAGDYADKLREVYEDLAVRGHKVVDKLGKKEAPAAAPVAEPAPAAPEPKPAATKPKAAAKPRAAKKTAPPAE